MPVIIDPLLGDSGSFGWTGGAGQIDYINGTVNTSWQITLRAPGTLDIRAADGDGTVTGDVFTLRINGVNVPWSSVTYSSGGNYIGFRDDFLLAAGTHTITLIVSGPNPDGSITSHSISPVSYLPAAPFALPDLANTNEDTAVTLTVLSNDSDVNPGDVLSVQSISNITGGSAAININGTVTFTPAANFNGIASFTYVVSDGTGRSSTAQATVNVAAVNDSPITVVDTLAATEDTAVTYAASDLLANDTDADGDTLTISAVSSPVGGTVVLNINGTVTFTPDANFSGAGSFSYTVIDGNGGTSTATATVNVAAVDDAAVAFDDESSTHETSSVIVDILGNDSDVDDPALQIVQLNGVAASVGQAIELSSGATVTLKSDGTVIYDPNGAFDNLVGPESGGSNISATDSFQYMLAGGMTATVQVTIGGVSGAGDTIRGSAGDDMLVGARGTAMAGGTGNDTYYVTAAEGAVIEAGGEGADRVAASVSYVLSAGAEVEVLEAITLSATEALDLTGNEHGNRVLGNAGVNRLDGDAGNDILIGLDGDDVLIGGTGEDRMHGGIGNDTYYVDSLGDSIFEVAGEGSDRVAASSSYTLHQDSEVEVLEAITLSETISLNLTGSNFANTIIGNNGNNVLNGGGGDDALWGLAGNDLLIGGSGNDVMWGGVGDDTYYVDSSGDVVNEWEGQGHDRVATSVSYSLGSRSEVEVLEAVTLSDTNALNLTGSDFANRVIGNNGSNIVDGRGGNDVLLGGGGADTFAFTTALGGSNIDRILDFEVGLDKIGLDDDLFGTGLGALNPDAFRVGNSAGDAGDRIIYDSETGALYFDADGSGVGAAVQFATLQPNLNLSASDFVGI